MGVRCSRGEPPTCRHARRVSTNDGNASALAPGRTCVYAQTARAGTYHGFVQRHNVVVAHLLENGHLGRERLLQPWRVEPLVRHDLDRHNLVCSLLGRVTPTPRARPAAAVL